MTNVDIVTIIIMYLILGFVCALVSSIVYENSDPDIRHIAVFCFWPLFIVFGIIRLFIVAVVLIVKMLFNKRFP